MAKVIGFNEDVAAQQEDKKREAQRKGSLRRAGRNVRFVKDLTSLSHSMDLKGVKV